MKYKKFIGFKIHLFNIGGVFSNLWSEIRSIIPATAGLHLGFLEGRGPDFEIGANQYKTKKKEFKSCIGDNLRL